MTGNRLITRRLTLRPAGLQDLAPLYHVMSNPAAMRYWSTLPHADLTQTGIWLDRQLALDPATTADFVLEHQGAVVGLAGSSRLPEVGFILHPDHWGRGFASEAMQALIPHLFARFPVAELTADADPRNIASLTLLARLGFRETGRAARTFLLGDEWCDSVYLALPRPRLADPLC